MNGLYVPIATDEQSIANTSFVHETAHFKDKPHQLLRFIHEKGGFCGQDLKMSNR